MVKWFKYCFLLVMLSALVTLSIPATAGQIQPNAQNAKIDSLVTLLKTDKEDTNKVNHLNELGWELKNSNPDTAIIVSSHALLAAEKLEWKKGIASSLNQLGIYSTIKADYPSALDYYLKALKVDEELKDKIGMGKVLGNIGSVYKEQGDYTKALDYYFMALKTAEVLGNKKSISINLGNLGIVYFNQNNYTKALDYYFKALKMDEELGNKKGIATHLCNIGVIYHDKADYPQALDYYFKALKIHEELGRKDGIAVQLGNIGSIYTSQGNYTEAEKYLLDALDLDKQIGMLDNEMDVEQYLSNLYSKTNRHQLALVHYKNAMALKDTIFNEEKNKEITRKEMNYDFEKKVAGAKAEQDKKDTVTQIIIYSVSAGFALVLVLAVFIFRGYRQKQKANIIISEQKQLVEEKQKDILDSIHYAKRIQQSLLPTEKYIQKNLTRLQRN